jgi:hypothetical protein
MKMLSCNCREAFVTVSRHSFGETEEKHGSPSVSVSSSNKVLHCAVQPNSVKTFNKGLRSRVSANCLLVFY